jgi:hypothetical protein
MRIALLSSLYKDAVHQISMQPKTFNHWSEHKDWLVSEYALWLYGWQQTFAAKGWDVMTALINGDYWESYQEENKLQDLSIFKLYIHQLKQFKPDVLWYDHYDVQLLKEIRSEVPSIRIVMGWSGSPFVSPETYQLCHFSWCCAPETVERLRNTGATVHHLHHAFLPEFLKEAENQERNIDFSFYGLLQRGSDYHEDREKLLLNISKELQLKIFTPAYYLGMKDVLKMWVKRMLYVLSLPFRLSKKLNRMALENSFLKHVFYMNEMPSLPYNPALKPFMAPPVFGRNMLRFIAASKMTLNIHANSSPTHASNMRMFEVPGMGACLLTDNKQNIRELYEPDKEILVYSDANDCLDKIKYYTQHPAEVLKIGQAGQQRCLRDHTYNNRYPRVLEEIEKFLGTKM